MINQQPNRPSSAQNPPNPAQQPLTLRKPLLRPIRPATAPAAKPIGYHVIELDQMLTTHQVAALLSISSETVRKWRQRHRGLAFYRFPDGSVRYALGDVVKFLQDSKVTD